MNKEIVFAALKKNTLEVMGTLDEASVTINDSLRALGANSIDRAEIIMMTLEALNIQAPMMDFAKAQNMDELCDLLLEKQTGE